MKTEAWWILAGMLLLAPLWLGWRTWRGQRIAAVDSVRGRASWYGEGYRGKTMANGQPFDPEAMTCAAWDWPLGSLLRVRERNSGRSVIVEVSDRGPARWTGNLIDLSARAFRRLGNTDKGLLYVEVAVLRTGPEVKS